MGRLRFAEECHLFRYPPLVKFSNLSEIPRLIRGAVYYVGESKCLSISGACNVLNIREILYELQVDAKSYSVLVYRKSKQNHTQYLSTEVIRQTPNPEK